MILIILESLVEIGPKIENPLTVQTDGHLLNYDKMSGGSGEIHFHPFIL